MRKTLAQPLHITHASHLPHAQVLGPDMMLADGEQVPWRPAASSLEQGIQRGYLEFSRRNPLPLGAQPLPASAVGAAMAERLRGYLEQVGPCGRLAVCCALRALGAQGARVE